MDEDLLQVGRDIVAALERSEPQEARRLAASLMGKISSPNKAAASAENGKLGGRVKGTTLSAETKQRISDAQKERWGQRQRAAEPEAEQQPKRGPGRPRTNPLPEGPKRGRGRPKRSVAEETA
jgi:hypothetical protein